MFGCAPFPENLTIVQPTIHPQANTRDRHKSSRKSTTTSHKGVTMALHTVSWTPVIQLKSTQKSRIVTDLWNWRLSRYRRLRLTWSTFRCVHFGDEVSNESTPAHHMITSKGSTSILQETRSRSRRQNWPKLCRVRMKTADISDYLRAEPFLRTRAQAKNRNKLNVTNTVLRPWDTSNLIRNCHRKARELHITRQKLNI